MNKWQCVGVHCLVGPMLPERRREPLRPTILGLLRLRARALPRCRECLQGALQVKHLMGKLGASRPVLTRHFRCWHAICKSRVRRTIGSVPSREAAIMLELEPYYHNASGDPVVNYATDDEIAIADHLRHRLEERYLKRGDAASSGSSEA